MAESLAAHFAEFHYVGPLDYSLGARILGSLRHRIHHVRGETYRLSRDRRAVRSLARDVEDRIRRVRPDVVFSLINSGSSPLAYARHDGLKVMWTDLTFPRYVEEYERVGAPPLAKSTLRDGLANEREMLRRTDLAVYASEWAASSARAEYGDVISAEKIVVVPLGANNPVRLSSDRVVGLAAERGAEVCRLLFVGMDWEGKRGSLTLETVTELNRRGVRTHLDIVGLVPPITVDPEQVTVHGLIDRTTEVGDQRYTELLTSSHFMFVPSRAEAMGYVFAEATAAALPSIATDVGGVSEAVEHGVTGFRLPPDAGPSEYADVIGQAFGDRDGYAAMTVAAHQRFLERLNWETNARRVVEHILDRI